MRGHSPCHLCPFAKWQKIRVTPSMHICSPPRSKETTPPCLLVSTLILQTGVIFIACIVHVFHIFVLFVCPLKWPKVLALVSKFEKAVMRDLTEKTPGSDGFRSGTSPHTAGCESDVKESTGYFK